MKLWLLCVLLPVLGLDAPDRTLEFPDQPDVQQRMFDRVYRMVF